MHVHVELNARSAWKQRWKTKLEDLSSKKKEVKDTMAWGTIHKLMLLRTASGMPT